MIMVVVILFLAATAVTTMFTTQYVRKNFPFVRQINCAGLLRNSS